MSKTLSLQESALIGGLALLFVILGLAYSVFTPIFENSDETLHYPYVKHLADGQGMPLAVPNQLWNQEGTQPPLYYAIVAASTFWLDTDNMLNLLQRNPHWLFSDVRLLINDNQNLVLHGPLDAFPYQRAALAVHIGRWWSLLFGLLTVGGTFLLARQLFPRHLPLALTAAALTALNPQFLRVSATVSNDSLSAALTTWAVLIAFWFTKPFTIAEMKMLLRGRKAEAISPSEAETASPAARSDMNQAIFLGVFTSVGTPPLMKIPPPQPRLRAAAGEGVSRASPRCGGIEGGIFLGGDSSQSPLLLRSPAPLPHYAPLLLGLLTGLAILTKLSSLSTLFLVAFIIFWRLFFLGETHQAPLQKILRWWLIMGVVVVALTGWWFWRNYSLYGEWFVTETHLNLAGRSSLSLAQIWGLRAEAERAFWATFGWGQIRPPEWVYSLLFAFSRVGLIGLGLAVLGKLVQGDRSRPLPLNLSAVNFEVIIPLLLWVALNLALYLRWLMEVGSVSHTRLIFPALAAISMLLALGWHTFLPHRLAGWFSGAVILAFLWLNVYSLGWLIYPAFRPTEQANQPANRLNLNFLDSLKLVSGQVDSSSTPAALETRPTATQGDVVLINAGWQTVTPPAKNYSVAAVLLAPDGRVLARRETYPGLGLRPTRYLQAGDSFVDTYPLKLEADVSEPLVARAVVNLFDFESDTRAGFPALDTSGSEVTPIVGEIKIVPKIWPEYQPSQAAQINFANAITLIGYDFIPPAEGTGEGTLTLYWQSLAPVNEDYVVFVHLLDEQGEMLGQADGPPTGNAYPTRWWSPGETIADTRSIPATAGLAALRLGLYDLASGQRLPIAESTLPSQDNSVEIALP